MLFENHSNKNDITENESPTDEIRATQSLYEAPLLQEKLKEASEKIGEAAAYQHKEVGRSLHICYTLKVFMSF